MRIDAEAAARPGAVDLAGLDPGAKVAIVARDGRGSHRVETLHTTEPPPGAELFRFATVNDVHIGAGNFGYFHTMADRSDHPVPYPVRCLRAALAEAKAWGAQALIGKGDLTDSGSAAQFDVFGREVAASGLDAHVVLGNHDVGRRAADAVSALAPFGITVATQPMAVPLPGITVVLAQTAIPGKGWGSVDGRQRAAIAELLAGAGGPCFLAMHHYPQRFVVPTMWPRGIAGPEARALLDAVAEANPATLVASGHSHRHRRHHHGPLTHAEIGSTKDYPGAWAGYVVHEGGIRQVVRRVADPAAIAWTEYTKRAVGGIWGRWSPGVRSHRCFSLTWPGRS